MGQCALFVNIQSGINGFTTKLIYNARKFNSPDNCSWQPTQMRLINLIRTGTELQVRGQKSEIWLEIFQRDSLNILTKLTLYLARTPPPPPPPRLFLSSAHHATAISRFVLCLLILHSLCCSAVLAAGFLRLPTDGKNCHDAGLSSLISSQRVGGCEKRTVSPLHGAFIADLKNIMDHAEINAAFLFNDMIQPNNGQWTLCTVKWLLGSKS